MNRIVTARLGLLCALLIASLTIRADNIPVLLKLEYVFNNEAVSIPVKVKTGTVSSPKPGQTPDRWRLLPGNPYEGSEPRPANRAVEFYQGKDTARILLMRVEVRYYRRGDGHWVAHFQPHENPLVAFDGKRWVPIAQPQGKSGLIALHGGLLPNAEGYYPTLEFGLITGRSSIDSWVVY
jgi:hypothetical protein